ncbi:hypothetical protein GCM10023082_59700 [Streptomyces tremellae]|uniref:Uncharacterized protein n=1 Tax=Streptomyces tremellae TaxID=1124239 RepID=A0ABP7GBY0_9ACTN
MSAVVPAPRTAEAAPRTAAAPAPADTRYRVVLARGAADVRAAQRLRHQVFAGELGALLDVPGARPPRRRSRACRVPGASRASRASGGSRASRRTRPSRASRAARPAVRGQGAAPAPGRRGERGDRAPAGRSGTSNT